jgi:pyruvate dehydrogenase (quinone)
MARTVADMLIDRLSEWGVDTIFGLPGDGINGIFEGLRTHQDKIKFVQVRHEEAAAFAACGYAKYTGRLGVCLATSGPGGIHLLNGLYDAKYDGQPVLAITGHTFHDLIGTYYQQDVDLDKLFMDVAEYNERVMGPHHLYSVVDEAIRTALSRRCVAHITIPKDIQDWEADDTPKSKGNIANHSADTFAAANPLPSQEYLKQAADILNQGKKVAILAGRGALNAGTELTEVAERLGAPIAKALLGKAVISDTSPYTTGGIGLLGTSASVKIMSNCDTLLIVGSSFPYMQFLPKPDQAKCVQIDLDPTRIGLRHPVDVPLVGDCHRILQALLPLLQPKKDRGFLEMAQKEMKDWDELLKERASRKDRPMKPQVVAHAVNRFLADDAIIVSDCGTVTTWAARYVNIRDRMMFSCTGLLATMANSVPYSVGAAIGHPGRQVVCLSGDGGLTMLMCELATVAKYKLPIKIIVFKNNVLGQIKWEQMVMEGNPQFGVELQPIDFAAVARACGMGGFTLEDPEKADEVLRQAFEYQGPALVEAVIDPNEPPLPGNITIEQAWNFAKSLIRGEKYRKDIIKTVLEDKIREVV